ncbi:MAG: hypothetical protein IKD11_02550, partial [Oscillospiraceae bacterium]|nr:hypothetical protein [Oscillospiraceae bacterium]
GVSDEEASVLGLPFERTQDGIRMTVQSTAEVTAMIIKHPALFFDFELTKGKMDDIFLAVTGKRLTHGEQDESKEREKK